MTKMPMKIWVDCYPCGSQIADDDYQPVGTPYINAEQLAEKMRGMKESEDAMLEETNDAHCYFRMCGFNAALDEVLKMLEE